MDLNIDTTNLHMWSWPAAGHDQQREKLQKDVFGKAVMPCLPVKEYNDINKIRIKAGLFVLIVCWSTIIQVFKALFEISWVGALTYKNKPKISLVRESLKQVWDWKAETWYQILHHKYSLYQLIISMEESGNACLPVIVILESVQLSQTISLINSATESMYWVYDHVFVWTLQWLVGYCYRVNNLIPPGLSVFHSLTHP